MSTSNMSLIMPKIKILNSPPKVFPKNDYVLYFDGCSKGNPGPAGIGAVIYHNGIEIWGSCNFIGFKKTNNEAEYKALIFGLEAAIDLNIKKLSVCGDSLLIIKQVNQDYKVKHPNLLSLYEEVLKLKQNFEYIDFNHVYRNENKRADLLSNLALQNFQENDLQDIIHEETKDWEEEPKIQKLLNSNKK